MTETGTGLPRETQRRGDDRRHERDACSKTRGGVHERAARAAAEGGAARADRAFLSAAFTTQT